MNKFPFAVPFVRWADTVRIEVGSTSTLDRQIYDHELVYVMEGNSTLILEGRLYNLEHDNLFLVKPGLFHSFLSLGQPHTLLGVHFDWEARPDSEMLWAYHPVGDTHKPELLRPAQDIEGWDTETHPALDLRGRPGVRRLLESVVTEFNRNDDLGQPMAGALLAAAIGQIAREVRLIKEVASYCDASPDAVRRVQRAREMLENPEAPLPSVEEIAHSVDWSGDHLRRMCRAVLGTSPFEIQSAARVRRAQELLRYSELSIGEVARRVGYDDPSHFTRVFRKATGRAPREWIRETRIQSV